MNPKKLSKSELMSDNRSLKKGMTSAMIKAKIQVQSKIAAQLNQPTTVCSTMCLVPAKSLKKTKRADPEA